MSTATLPRILFALLLLTASTASAQADRWELYTIDEGTALERRGGGIMETDQGTTEEPRIAFVVVEKERPYQVQLAVNRKYPEGLLCSVSGRVVIDDLIFDDLDLSASVNESATYIDAGDDHQRMLEAIATGRRMIIEIESRRCDVDRVERMKFSLTNSAQAIGHARSLKRSAE